MSRRLPLFPLLAILALAQAGRILLIASGTVSFHSDEAVVGLMARHILEGERPVFFYGQAYMGSLDAWLIAVGFALLGESVLTIRVVQSVLYLLMVATSYAVAWRVSGRVVVAAVAALVITVPNVLVALYTTATLGGYNETLLLGNLILLLGWDVTHEHRRSVWRWAALGLCAGVGWWTNGLIVAFVLPVGVLGLVDLWRNARGAGLKTAPTTTNDHADVGAYGAAPLQTTQARQTSLLAHVGLIAVAAVCFFIGSAPWWGFNFEHDFAALRFYLPSDTPSAFAGTDIPPLPTDQRLIGLFLLGLPAVIGLRFPWLPDYFLPALGIVVLAIYAVAVIRLLRRNVSLKPDGRLLVGGMIALFCGVFIVSRFSIDPTGRYFLPLVVPLAIALGALTASVRSPILRIVIVGVVISYNVIGVVTAVRTNPPGMTTQFNLDTHIPNDDDAALIAFLEDRGLIHGYTNYWISFRLAFLSDDRLQYSATLPYKPGLSYTPFDERYSPYRAATDAAPDEQIAYVTANIAEVRERLEAIFAARGVTYAYMQVGVYHIYYDFAPEAPRPPLDFDG